MTLSFKHIITVFILLTSFYGLAQDELIIKGTVKDEETLKKLENCQVIVFQNGVQFDTYECGTSGKYEFRLPLGYTYDIKFTRAEYVSKSVRVDSRNIPEEDRAGGFQLDLPGVLFKMIEGFNTDIMKEPVVKLAFSSQENSLAFDEGYTERMKEKIAAEKKRLEALQNGQDKMKADFDKLVREGDQKVIEKKYKDGMDKFTEALKLFPQDAPAKKKYDDAKALYDAELAAAAGEAKYAQLLKDGDAAISAKKWEDAKKKFTEAKNMKPQEKLPKEKLYEIDQLMANAEKQAEYDAFITAADKDFSNKDYALSIDKYKKANQVIPSISYPKDQIAKAQAALDQMLADAAKKQQIEQRYNDLMALGEKNKGEAKYESAISNYRDASQLKPEENTPKNKIKEIEDLLAQMERDRQKSEADALANKQKEELERQFNDLVQQADKLYTSKSWDASKSKYLEALALKEAQYPRARIASIDDILAQEKAKSESDALAEANRLKEEERKKREEELLQLRLEEERLAEEQRQKRLAEEEEERKRKEEEMAKANKPSNFNNNANRDNEDDVEKYYREARQLEDSIKYAAVRNKAQQHQNFLEQRGRRTDDKIRETEMGIASTKDNMLAMNNRGNSFTARSTAETNALKEQDSKNDQDYAQRANGRIDASDDQLQDKKKAQEGITQNDRNRQKLITEQKNKKAEFDHNNKGFETKGGTLRTDNSMKIDKQKKNQSEMAFDGEKVRQENEKIAEEQKSDQKNKMIDTQTAANVRLETTNNKIEEQKESAISMSSDERNNTSSAMMEITEKKEQAEMLQIKKQNKAAGERYDKRKELFNVNTGQNNTERPTPGSENVPEGVSEKSYKLNSQMITERTVKTNGKVNVYLKSVSKTGIYYFKNGRPITKQTWIQETLETSE